MLGQLILMGLAAGCGYALIAMAMVIVYKTSEILNFAQSELAMFSTFIAYALLTSAGVGFVVAFGGALLFSMLLGASCELLFLQPARERQKVIPLILLWTFTGFVSWQAIFSTPQAPPSIAICVLFFAIWVTTETFSKRPPREASQLGLIIITLGLEMILYGLAGMFWGASQASMPTPVDDLSVYRIAGLVISDLNILTFIVSIAAMLGLFAFFRYTRVGTAMQAIAQNPLAARLMGVRTGRIYALTWALSSLVGATGGLLIASAQPLDPNLMLEPLLKGFAAAVLGGITSLPGAVLGGGLLGVTENLVAGYMPDGAQFKSTVAFLVIVLALCFRPGGLLGRHYVKKV